MNTSLSSLTIGLLLMAAIVGCRQPDMPKVDIVQSARIADVPEKKKVDEEFGDLPDIIGLESKGYGPRIKIQVNGDPYLDTALRDSEAVSAGELGNYLARISFRSTKKVRLKADEADPKKANLKATFKLHLHVNREPLAAPLLTVTFSELRLKQGYGGWVLTPEGIELIEKAIPKKD